jgi:hypothetical protein
MVGLITLAPLKRYYRVNGADWVFFVATGLGIRTAPRSRSRTSTHPRAPIGPIHPIGAMHTANRHITVLVSPRVRTPHFAPRSTAALRRETSDPSTATAVEETA